MTGGRMYAGKSEKMLTYRSFSFSIVRFLSEWTWFDVARHSMAWMHAVNSNHKQKYINVKIAKDWLYIPSLGMVTIKRLNMISVQHSNKSGWMCKCILYIHVTNVLYEIIFIEKYLAASGSSCIITVRKVFIPMEKRIPLLTGKY